MNRIALMLPLATAVAACAPMTQDGEMPSSVSGGECGADGLDNLTGQPASSELAAEALQRSGAKIVRWIQPGTAVTMDYRTDRLNISLDEENVVTGFKCG